ncbi:10259_t:CDS:2, partial [Diversispora eburnea]
PRPHPLHGSGIITPFQILNAWEAQCCPLDGILHKWILLTNNQLQGISAASQKLVYWYKE